LQDCKILIIDNDYGYASELKEWLQKNNLAAQFALSASKALEIARTALPEIIFLEVDLPETDGLELLQELKKLNGLKNSFMVFLSNRNDNYVQIMAYNNGADDYVIKPVNERVLLSKINAYLRRLGINYNHVKNYNGINLKIDFEKYLIYKNNQEIELPKKEFEILSLLFKSPKKVFTREEIKKQIWGMDDAVKFRTIDVHVKKLREKIGDNLIKTIKGVGYKLEYD
jgi:two-component system alkaline phosphatase synthesis response regulator PhoP